MDFDDMFESSVNSYGRQTVLVSGQVQRWFESSVNSYGRQTTNADMC